MSQRKCHNGNVTTRMPQRGCHNEDVATRMPDRDVTMTKPDRDVLAIAHEHGAQDDMRRKGLGQRPAGHSGRSRRIKAA